MAKKKTSQDLKRKLEQGKKDLVRFEKQRQELDEKIEQLHEGNKVLEMEYWVALAVENGGINIETAILAQARRQASAHGGGG